MLTISKITRIIMVGNLDYTADHNKFVIGSNVLKQTDCKIIERSRPSECKVV